METIYLDDFLDEGIIKEKSFRKKVSEINWDDYNYPAISKLADYISKEVLTQTAAKADSRS